MEPCSRLKYYYHWQMFITSRLPHCQCLHSLNLLIHTFLLLLMFLCGSPSNFCVCVCFFVVAVVLFCMHYVDHMHLTLTGPRYWIHCQIFVLWESENCAFFFFFFLAFQYPEPGFPDYFLSTSIKLIKIFQHQIHPGNKAAQISHAIIFKLSENLDFVTILNIL